VTTLWCAAGGWSVGTVEAGSAERGKNGGWPREQEEKESHGSRGLRCGWRLWLGGGVAVFGGERRR